MPSTYQVYICDPSGNRLYLLTGTNILSLNAMAIASDIGVLTLTVGGSLFPFSKIAPYSLIEVYRTNVRGATELLYETKWIMLDRMKIIDSGARTYTIIAWSGMAIIDGGEVEYMSGSSQASKSGHADDVIKTIAAENFGSSVTDATRKSYNPPLAIQASVGAAPTVTKDFARQNCKSLFQALCQMSAQDPTTPTPLYFDVAWSASLASFELRTYINQRGSDVSSKVTFSPANKNLLKGFYEEDYRQHRNWIYALGQDTGANRHVMQAKDTAQLAKSVYALREQSINSNLTATSNDTSLQNEANAGLWQYRPMVNIGGQIVDLPACAYGSDWHFGDKVTVTVDEITTTALVNAVTINLQGGVETFSVALRAQL